MRGIARHRARHDVGPAALAVELDGKIRRGGLLAFGQYALSYHKPRAGGELSLGLKFARPLGADEWARITETRRPTVIPALAPVRPGPPIQVLVTDPDSGPVCLLRALRGASSFVEGRVDAQRPMTAVELRGALGVDARPARVSVGETTLWSGDAIARDVHASSTDGLCVTLEFSSPLPDPFLRRLGRTS